MKQLLAEIFKGPNGLWDLARVVMGMMAIAYIAQSVYAIVHGQHFDWQAFGVGAGSITAGGGAGVWMHGKDRP